MSALPIALVASFLVACIVIRISRPFQYPRRTIREMYLVAASLSLLGASASWAHLVAGLIVWGVTLPFFYVFYGVSPRSYRYGAKYRDRKPRFDTRTRIAVLGAGASGLAAAEELRELGYENVTIMEAGAEVGGKTGEHEVHGIRYETGTVWFFPGPDYERYCEKYGLKAPDMLSGILAPVQVYDLASGKLSTPWLAPASSFSGRLALGRFTSLAKYLRHSRPFAHPHEAGVTGPLYDDPRETAMPMHEWLARRGLQAFEELLAPLYEVFVLGAYRQMPALYMLEILGQVNRATFRQLAQFDFHQVAEGNPEIFRRIAASFGDRMMRRTRVTKVRSVSEDGPLEVTYRRPKTGEETQEFDHVVWAMPLTHFNDICDDADPEAREIFGDVRCLKRAIVIAEVEGLPEQLKKATLVFKSWDAETHVNALDDTFPRSVARLPRSYETDEQIYKFFHCMGPEDSVDDVKRQARELMERLGATRFDCLKVHVHEGYNPHFSSEQVSSGMYARVDALQGRRNVYYTSELIQGSIGVTGNMEHGVEIAHRFFGADRA